jgi:Transposase domain (DUF772)
VDIKTIADFRRDNRAAFRSVFHQFVLLLRSSQMTGVLATPVDFLKLYVYGYLNRVRSSRRLEMERRRNFEVIWLLRSLKPDIKTIADFRRDNRAAFRSVFHQFVLLDRN